jgi:glycosyltransferase involved in cell wall biosynthesis
MRIGVYLENRDIPEIDLSKPDLGNPGIGGTEYQFLLLAQNLMKIQTKEILYEVFVFANEVDNLSPVHKNVKVENIYQAYELANDQLNIDYFIYRPRRRGDVLIEEKIRSGKIKVIPWLHITPNRDVLNFFAKEVNIPVCVFVGDDQRMRCIDTEVFKKSVTIYNCYPSTVNLNRNFEQMSQQKNVTYLGALVPAKGFHVLAEAWPKILKLVPEAKLNVIGSGNLYNHSAKIGEFTKADEKYERTFINYLLEAGKLLPSVKFHGRLGVEKLKIFESTNVGVINPTGQTENCPISAIEMELVSIPIVTSRKYGMRDMVVNGYNGFLINTPNALAKRIAYLLKNPMTADKFGSNSRSYASKKFDSTLITCSWILLFDELNELKIPRSLSKLQKGYYVHKWSRVLRKLKLIPFSTLSTEEVKATIIRKKLRYFYKLSL